MVTTIAKIGYSEDSIKHLAKLDHIRHRPTGYITDVGVGGQFHIIKELIDNSIDELENFRNSPDGLLEISMFKDLVNKKYQILVSDNGRGIPIDKLIDVFTNPNTSGKFDTSSYKFSAGTFGIGAKATTALSDFFRVIVMKNGVLADATIHHSNIPDQPLKYDNFTNIESGSFVLFEPDASIFEDIEEFSHSGFLRIEEFLSQLSLFSKYRIVFKVFNVGVSDSIKNSTTDRFVEFLLLCRSTSSITNVVFDNNRFDREKYIKEFFTLNKNFEFKQLLEDNSSDDLKYTIDVRCIKTHNMPNNTKLTFVNGIMFTDGNSFHIQSTIAYIKEQLAKLIPEQKMKDFFISQYKLPIWLIMDVKFSGAQFSGTIKHQFRDIAFKKVFDKSMHKLFDSSVIIKDLYDLLDEHIVAAFNRFSNNDLIVKNVSNMLMRLNHPKKFSDCNTSERDKAELFLVEGESAKSDQGRDSEYQATYILSGKPLNALTSQDKMFDSLDNLRKNKIYQDIIRILGIVPGSNDLSSLNFGKTFITTDADVHGYHIASILLSNLYILSPALIEEGRIYVVMPPLYGIKVKGSKELLYVRNTKELNATLAYHLYYKCLDIYIESNAYNKQKLNIEEFVAFSEIVELVGEVITNLSKEYAIPAVILEQLSLMTVMLNRSLLDADIELFEKAFGCKVKYHKESQVLILIIGSEDIIIPLYNINDLIYKKILPLYKDFFYMKMRIYATTKRTDHMNISPVSIVQLFQMFNEMKKLFSIERYKGLGSMNPKDRSKTCINKETRRTFQITTIGDIDTVFNMMGTDSTTRKELVLA